ncbi:unnamed protein product [Sphenostylis stenocarpa]|uniref:Late embryogenesis abundant protein LEA-2 subgroup domain-containing protein n=1 Tax=Sphenostylis stenocarpa TaxID=92480 RepID=A0AA86VTC3_9FABA|nr:unnamed protein product [Sphenostylis stenocarpa]
MPRLNRNHYVNLIHIAAGIIITCLVGITVILMCIVFTPHLPSFQVTSLTVSPVPISTTVQQTVTFHFQGILQNPNVLLAVWYKSLHLELWFNNSSILSTPLEPPPLSKGVMINIPFQAKFVVPRSNFSDGVLEEIAAQRRVHDSVNFRITLIAWIKFKFSGMSFRPHPLSLNCYPLQVSFTPDDYMNNKNDTGRLVAPSQCNAV